jgi:uncharacterized protein
MSFTPETAALLVAIGLAAGALGTLIGAGGGFILTPILLFMYPHDSPKTLTAISITAVFFNAASGSSAYARQRRIDYRSGTVFALATLPGAIAGALAVSVVSRAVFDDIMGGVLLTLALLLLTGERFRLPEPRRHLEHRLLVDRRGQSHEYSVPIRLGAAYSVGVGFLSSFLGIGGGVIHVPLLVSALGFPTHIATATSHFVLTITAATGTVTHLFLGSFGHGSGLRRAAALSVGMVAGAQVGARFSLRLRGIAIQWLLATALLAIAARLFYGA